MSVRRPIRLTRRSKYGAVRTTVDGIAFDSKKEARRYQELRLLEQAGEIWDLECQPVFVLCVPSTVGTVRAALKAMANGGSIRLGEYRGDFKYQDKTCDGSTWPYIVEDVKSPATRTALYRWKKKHVEAQYGIRITEV